jgi:hypothetical protein
MTKEQIYEKITVITTGPNCIADMKVDSDKLASYLATIEERLEKVEGKITALEILYTQHEEFDHTPPEVKDWEVQFENQFGKNDYYIGYRNEIKAVTFDEAEIKSFIRNLLNNL